MKVIQIKPTNKVREIGVGNEECILETVSRGASLVQPMETGLLYLNASEEDNSRTDHKSL